MPSCRHVLAVCLLALVLGVPAAAAPDAGTVAEPKLEVLGEHATEGVKLHQADPELKHVLRLYATSPADVASVRVVVTPLRDSTGRLWEVSWDLGGKGRETPVPVPSMRDVPLTLSGQLPFADTYAGELFLVYGKTPRRVRLTVTRGLLPLPVEVLGLEPVTGTADFFSPSEASVRFTVRETSGQGLTLKPVAVVGLSRVAKDAIQFEAPFELKDPKDVALGSGTSQLLQLNLAGLAGAGEYKGTLRLSAEGRQPVDREFRVFLKEDWTVALACVVAGILGSLLLRWLIERLRPRLETQQATLLLRRDLELDVQALQPLHPSEHSVLTALLDELQGWVAEAGAGAPKPADAKSRQLQLQRKRELFPRWVAARRQVRALQPARLRESFEKPLEAARVRLTQRLATVEQLEESLTALEGLPGEIEVAARKELKVAIGALLAEVNAEREDVRSTLHEKLREQVKPELEAAQAALEDDSPRAWAAYGRARRTYLKLLAEQLAEQLRVPPPYGFEPGVWEELRGRVLAELKEAEDSASELDEAFASYERAHRLFLTGAARALMQAVPALMKKVEKDTELGSEDKQTRKDGLAAQKLALEVVLARVGEGKLREASVGYAEVCRELPGLAAPGKTRGSFLEKLSLAMAGSVALTLPVSTAVPGASRPPPRPRAISLGAVSQLRRFINVFVSIALAFIAGGLGLLSLWANDLTWGGWMSRIAAFLWGLGLHQATFSTLTDLAQSRFGGKEPL